MMRYNFFLQLIVDRNYIDNVGIKIEMIMNIVICIIKNKIGKLYKSFINIYSCHLYGKK